jgi:hypothetical protein
MHAPPAQPGCISQSFGVVHESPPKHSPVAPLHSGRDEGQSFALTQRGGGGQQEPCRQTRSFEHIVRSVHEPEHRPPSFGPASGAIETQVKSN